MTRRFHLDELFNWPAILKQLCANTKHWKEKDRSAVLYFPHCRYKNKANYWIDNFGLWILDCGLWIVYSEPLCALASLRENKSQKKLYNIRRSYRRCVCTALKILQWTLSPGWNRGLQYRSSLRLSKFCNEPYPPVETGGYNIDRAYGSQNFAMNHIPRLKPGATT